MSASTSPPVTAAILLCCFWFSLSARRPVRAALAGRFMSSDDGGVLSVATGGRAAFFGLLRELFVAARFTAFLAGFLVGLRVAFLLFFAFGPLPFALAFATSHALSIP